MNNTPSKCSDDKHLYPVRFVCQHEDCENSFLCLACFQTHYQDKSCRGVYGVDIKEIDGVFEDNYEIIIEATPVVKNESILEEHALKKTRLLERVQQVFDKESEIHRQNEKLLDEFEDSLVKCLKAKNIKWKQDQVKVIRGENTEIGNKVFPHLEYLKKILDADDNNSLNNEITAEAEELINLAEKDIDCWRLNKERLNNYLEIFSKEIEEVDFSSLFGDEKLEFVDSSSLKKFNEDYNLLKKESEILKPELNKLKVENEMLKGLKLENAELKKQIELLKRKLELRTTKRNELGEKVLEFEKMIQNLTDRNEDLKRSRDELDKEKRLLSKENKNLMDERDELKRKLPALIQVKDNFVKFRNEDSFKDIEGGLFDDDEEW